MNGVPGAASHCVNPVFFRCLLSFGFAVESISSGLRLRQLRLTGRPSCDRCFARWAYSGRLWRVQFPGTAVLGVYFAP